MAINYSLTFQLGEWQIGLLIRDNWINAPLKVRILLMKHLVYTHALPKHKC